jgi:hypothetical protein
MSKHVTIRAKSFDEAMQYAKTKFGRSAIVVDTRTTRVKTRDGLGIKSVYELVIDPGFIQRPGSADVKIPAVIDLAGGVPSQSPSSIDRVRNEIERIERLIHSVDNAEARLRSFDTAYPLNESLISGGVSDGAIRVLQSSYEDRVPSTMHGDPESARLHLLDYFNCSKTTSVAGMSGPHVFLGTAGSGKTSLIIKLAAELVREGRSVAVVTAVPFHSGEIRRIEEAASALMTDAAVVNSYEELTRTLRLYGDKDTVLIDTPCMLSRRTRTATDFFNKLNAAQDMFKHMVCSLTSDSDLLYSELDLYQAWNCDFLALSRIDLVRKCGKIFDIVLHRGVTFSFVSYNEDDGPGLQLATPALLLNLVSPVSGAGVSEGGVS